MVSKPVLPILLLLPLLFVTTIKSSSAAGINLTSIMEKYPDYHYFIDFLGQAHAIEPISQLDAVTVLVLTDHNDDGPEQFSINKLDGNGSIRALHTHVIPQYVDIQSATDKPVTYPTLFRTVLQAPRKMGYINMQKRSDGKVVFGSAVPGAPMNSEVVKTLVTQPPKVAVYYVTTLIVAPGLMQLPLPGEPGSTDPPTSSPSTASDADTASSSSATSATAPAAPSSPTSSATVAPMASVVHDTVAPKASTAPAASSPKASTATSAPKASESTTASTAPTGSESTTSTASAPTAGAGSPESGVASGPGAGGPTTMADGPSSADGPGPAAASGAGRVAFGAEVGIGIAAAVILSL